MTKDIIKDTIRRGITNGTLTIEDVLVFVNEVFSFLKARAHGAFVARVLLGCVQIKVL